MIYGIKYTIWRIDHSLTWTFLPTRSGTALALSSAPMGADCKWLTAQARRPHTREQQFRLRSWPMIRPETLWRHHEGLQTAALTRTVVRDETEHGPSTTLLLTTGFTYSKTISHIYVTWVKPCVAYANV